MGKFFNVTIYPTITASNQHEDHFDAGEILFDWTAFNVPKGAAKLLNITVVARGVNGLAQVHPIHFVFAKTIDGVAPGSLGTANAAVSGTGFMRNTLGFINHQGGDMTGELRYFSVGAGRVGSRVPSHNIILEGEPNTGISVGYDKLYIAGMNEGAADWDFGTAVETTALEDISAMSVATIGAGSALDDGSGGSASANTKFEPGDIIYTEGNRPLGEIASLNATTITFKHDGSKQYHANGEVLYTNPANFAAWQADTLDVAANVELYNLHPLKLILHFER